MPSTTILSLVAVASLCVITASDATNGTATKHMLSKLEGELFGARCLDGSNYGFYISTNTSSTKWVIYMQGGGYCATKSDCDARAKTSLGSSKYWRDDYTLHGVTSNDGIENPDFHAWNKVIIPYCTGDLHSGQKRLKSYGTVYFAGHLNFARSLTVLGNKFQFGYATEVLLTGASAGGLGTLVNLDFLASQLPGVQVSGAPQAGWFLDWPPFTNHTLPIKLASELGYMVWSGFVDEDCKAARSSEPWYCYSGNYSFPYISTRLMVIEGRYDVNQLYVQDGAPPNNYSAPVCDYIAKFGDAMSATLQQVQSSSSSGLFLASCLIHGVAFNTVKIDSLSWQQVLGNWYFHRSGMTKVSDKCGAGVDIPCNPTCGQPIHVCPPTPGP